MGKALVEQMCFSDRKEQIEEAQKEVAEFMRIMREEEFPDNRYTDARPFLSKIRIEGLFLDIPELVALKNSLESLHAILRFFQGKTETYPVLTAKAGQIQLFPYVLQRLDSIVSKHGTIKDNASSELGEIRRQILKKQSGISRRMQALLQDAQTEGWAEKDTAIAIRDGRMVIPVPAAYKRRVNGIVHDESATGKTSYIEPTEIIETNNEIRELQLEEKREITRILRKFADDIRPYIEDLIPAYDFLAFVDYTKAKALFGIEMDAISPVFTSAPEMLWYEARHPLLYLSFKNTDKTLIPLRIEINEEQRIILISGPNAGGKSVCLQTAGLLQYMFQCGLPVPVSEASRFGIFKKILIDIGDEQSLENDLSTYSSHLINMKNFVRYGDRDTLVLIDEFGTGTEPMLGGAIAEAILHALNDHHVKGVITTHYTNLKHFASATPGIENGAMLYDNHRMMPLFQLEIGKPGSSFAFEIAKKIGLSKEILDEAASKVGEEHIHYDKHLKDIARDKRYWEEKRLKQKIEKIKKRENRKKKETPQTSPLSSHQPAEIQLQKGDFVKLPNQAVGEILEIKDKNAVIALGNIRTNVSVDKLEKVSANQVKKQIRTSSPSVYPDFRENISQKRLLFKPEIDVRGMRGEEALQKVTDFLDEAVMLDSKNLRILHGTGTGALRQIIRQFLSTNPLVGSYADEQVQLGGAGITVVKLDI